MVSRWTTEVTGWPVGRQSGSTICMPAISLGVSSIQENQCTNTHGHFSPSRVNEKKRCTQAISRPMIPCTDVEDNKPPSLSVLLWAALINKESWWPGPVLQCLTAWIHSCFIPPIPERSLGAWKVATTAVWIVIISWNGGKLGMLHVLELGCCCCSYTNF